MLLQIFDIDGKLERQVLYVRKADRTGVYIKAYRPGDNVFEKYWRWNSTDYGDSALSWFSGYKKVWL